MELANRQDVEAAFATRMGRLHGEFRNRLIELLGNPPDPANVPESFWIEAEDEMRREISIALLLIAGASAAQHGLSSQIGEMYSARWADLRADLVAPQWAANSRERLVARYQAPVALAGRVDPLSRRQTAVPPATPEEIAADVFNPSRAETIATTETTTATSAGGEIAVSRTVGLSLMDRWFTERDDRVCAICGPLHNATRDVWAAQFPNGPPAHVNCRCFLAYVREEVADAKG